MRLMQEDIKLKMLRNVRESNFNKSTSSKFRAPRPGKL